MVLTNKELQIVLTKSKNMEFRVHDFYNALINLGIKCGDTLCVHSELIGFGLPAIRNNDYLDLLIKIFMSVVGDEGTLLMPTFTYSFCKGEKYSVSDTPSTVGILTEFFRNYEEVYRTKHPIFSFAVWGKRKKDFLDTGFDAFGINSVFDKMMSENNKIVMFGAAKGYTCYHQAEQIVGVKHRYFKEFTGFVIDKDNEATEITVPYYVRCLDMRSSLDEIKLNIYLNEQSIQKNIKINQGNISVFSLPLAMNYFLTKLKEDELFFIKEEIDG